MSYSEEQYLKNTRDSFQAGRVIGMDEERERIIKLLENHAYEYLTTPEAISRDLSEDWHKGFADAIVFIKGEQK